MNSDKTRTTLKQEAAEFAVRFIESGMVIGLGHGSTAIHAIRKIAQMLQNGMLANILAVPCSLDVHAEARALGIPITTLDEHPVLDVTIDGADEVSPKLHVIKGGGGALLREKIVAQATLREIIVVDDSKLSNVLGTRWAVPLEVVPFGLGANIKFLESLGAEVSRRNGVDGSEFFSDQGNLILDANFGAIDEPEILAQILAARAGIIEHGLFLNEVTDVIIAGLQGIEHRQREKQA